MCGVCLVVILCVSFLGGYVSTWGCWSSLDFVLMMLVGFRIV